MKARISLLESLRNCTTCLRTTWKSVFRTIFLGGLQDILLVSNVNNSFQPEQPVMLPGLICKCGSIQLTISVETLNLEAEWSSLSEARHLTNGKFHLTGCIDIIYKTTATTRISEQGHCCKQLVIHMPPCHHPTLEKWRGVLTGATPSLQMNPKWMDNTL